MNIVAGVESQPDAAGCDNNQRNQKTGVAHNRFAKWFRNAEGDTNGDVLEEGDEEHRGDCLSQSVDIIRAPNEREIPLLLREQVEGDCLQKSDIDIYIRILSRPLRTTSTPTITDPQTEKRVRDKKE